MKYGYGAPTIEAYFNGQRLDHKLLDFSYKYSEKEDDTCQFKIRDTYNPNLPDEPPFQEGAIWTITWYYLGQPQGPIRTIALRDIKVTYDDNEVAMDLLFTDVASRIKIGAKKRIHKDTTLAKLAEQVATEAGLKFKNEVSFNVGYKRDEYIDKGAIYTTEVDNVAYPMKGTFKTHEEVVQSNKSDFQILDQLADQEPDGPYQVVGRDDELILQRLTLTGKAIELFTYGGTQGVLLNFTPETKSRTRKAEATEINLTLNSPGDKSYGNLMVDSETNGVPQLGDTADSNNPEESENWLWKDFKTFLTGGALGVLKDKFEAIVRETNTENNIATTPTPEQTANLQALSGKFTKPAPNMEGGAPLPDRPFNEGIISERSVVPYQGVTNSSLSEFQASGNITSPSDATSTTFVRPKYSREILTSEEDKEKAAAEAKNKQAMAALNKNPAEANVVGNPAYISGKLYTFENVSKKYSGTYYAIECTHTITETGGWVVSFMLHRNGDNTPVSVSPSKKRVDPNKKATVIIPASNRVDSLGNPRFEEPALLKTIREVNGSNPLEIPVIDVPILER